jgi:hypothetical protein
MFGCAGGVAIIAFVAGLVTGGLVPGWRSALGLSIGLCAGGGIGSAVMSTPTPYDIGLATKIFTGVEYVATFGLLFALAGFGLIALARSLSKAMRPTPE